MKTKLVIVITILLTSISLHAQTLPREMFGVWRGIRMENVNGVTYTGTQTLRVTPIQGGRGASMSSTIVLGSVVITANGVYSPDGTYFSQAFVNGVQLGTTFGSWRMNRRGISGSGTTQDITGVYSGDISIRLAGPKTLIANGAQSNGGAVSIRLKK